MVFKMVMLKMLYKIQHRIAVDRIAVDRIAVERVSTYCIIFLECRASGSDLKSSFSCKAKQTIITSVDVIYKSFHEMKGDRDGKSAKRSATRNCLYSAVVVNDHMYPCPCLYHHFMFL